MEMMQNESKKSKVRKNKANATIPTNKNIVVLQCKGNQQGSNTKKTLN
jgi:hypothetical protein